MRYGGIIFDDFANGKNVCTSIFLQGCPIKCHGCHNPDLQDFSGGKNLTEKEMDIIVKSLTANNIQRNLCILGGEPLCDANIFTTYTIIQQVKSKVPNAKIFVWTGYGYEQLINNQNSYIDFIIRNIDILIDGPYIEKQRNVTLAMRGSENQRLINTKETIKQNKIVEYKE